MQRNLRTKKPSILVGPLSSAMLMHWLQTLMIMDISTGGLVGELVESDNIVESD